MDPKPNVLVVGHIRAQTLRELRAALPGRSVTRFRLTPENGHPGSAVPDSGDELADPGAEPEHQTDDEPAPQAGGPPAQAVPAESQPGIEPERVDLSTLQRNLEQRLEADPSIHYLLALGREAQELLTGTLRHRDDVYGFGNVAALKRCLQRGIEPDLSPLAGRLVSPAHVYEALPVTGRRRRGRRVLIGPDNHWGLATTLKGAIDAADVDLYAEAVAVGSAWPAPDALTQADWSVPEVRAALKRSLRRCTHFLATSDTPALPIRRRVRRASLAGFGHPTGTLSLDPRSSAWLPFPLPQGIWAERGSVDDRPRVLLLSDELPDGLPTLGDVTVQSLRDVPAVLQLPTARAAAIVVDLRSRPLPDPPVLAAMVNGATVISDLSDFEGVPFRARGADPWAVLQAELESGAGSPDEETRAYVREHHDGTATVATLMRHWRLS